MIYVFVSSLYFQYLFQLYYFEPGMCLTQYVKLPYWNDIVKTGRRVTFSL